MKYKNFKSGLEMYNYIHNGIDLYSKSLGKYIFDYNDAGALCIYSLSPEDVVQLIRDSKENDCDNYWSSFLGWKGSTILDALEYNDDKYRYSNNWELNKLYLKPSLDFCEKTYMIDWVDTRDVNIEYVLSK